MGRLALLLSDYHNRIAEYLYVGYAQWDDLVARVGRQERESSAVCIDEQVWTFLAACGYALAREDGVARLTKAMTGTSQSEPARARIWFEVLPTSPRKREGETHVDLALGTIALRAGTESGIELEALESSWVCFCEAKWYSDISPRVSHDIHRNQLARVIENAMCFQQGKVHAERLYVTLLTPKVFREASLKTRLYQYKYQEYDEGSDRIMEELDACTLKKREQPDWIYPDDLKERFAALSFHWSTYDELFGEMPDSPIAASLRQFWTDHGKYQGRFP